MKQNKLQYKAEVLTKRLKCFNNFPITTSQRLLKDA